MPKARLSSPPVMMEFANFFEYEAKENLTWADIPVLQSVIVWSPQDVVALPTVLKSQVPTGGRGKADGVKVVEDTKSLPSVRENILSFQINEFTPKVLLAEEVPRIQHEYYLSLLINKEKPLTQLMAHKNGGVEVEENDPASFLTITLDGRNAEGAGEQLAEYFDLLARVSFCRISSSILN